MHQILNTFLEQMRKTMDNEERIKKSVEFLTDKAAPTNNLIAKLKGDSVLDLNDLNDEQQKILLSMIQSNMLTDIGRGIVIDNEWSPNDFLLRQLVLKQGIYSGNTALYLWNLSDQFPYTVDMTFKTGYKLPISLEKWTKNINVRQVNKSRIDLFIDQLPVPGTERKISLYSPERCLVESLHSQSNGFGNTAVFKDYLATPAGNANKLLLVAKKLGNFKKVRQILEILL